MYAFGGAFLPLFWTLIHVMRYAENAKMDIHVLHMSSAENNLFTPFRRLCNLTETLIDLNIPRLTQKNASEEDN